MNTDNRSASQVILDTKEKKGEDNSHEPDENYGYGLGSFLGIILAIMLAVMNFRSLGLWWLIIAPATVAAVVMIIFSGTVKRKVRHSRGPKQ